MFPETSKPNIPKSIYGEKKKGGIKVSTFSDSSLVLL